MRRSIVLAALAEERERSGSVEGSSSNSSHPVAAPKKGYASSALTPRTATGGGFGPLLGRKPFKAPTSASAKQGSDGEVTGRRKRQRVNYAGMGGEEDGDGEATLDAVSDDERKPKGKPGVFGKNGKMTSLEGVYKGIDARGVSLNVDNRKWDVFKPREGAMKQAFNIPVMRNKNGEVIETRLTGISLGTRKAIEIPPRPLHDPMAEHAIVLFDPTIDDPEAEREKERLRRERLAADSLAKTEAAGQLEEKAAGPTPHKKLADILGLRKEVKKVAVKVAVVIDPRLGKVLRPHQIEGVKFLYRCATSLVDEHAQGSIMADEMGLGKTLQCITLMWTLLKQSPIANKPTIEKAIIACPSSLVRNWANELVKWLGASAPGAFALDGALSREEMIAAVRRWADAKGRSIVQPVMIVSYETLRNISDELANCNVGLLLADEGHRLKNAESLTYQELDKIPVKRRVILTGTPVQNDLTEYFSLVKFANPDLLGGRLEFRRHFEMPIIKGRDAAASEQERQVGDAKLAELTGIVSKFIIRRTNDLLSKYLPIKYEHVVFCKVSDFQLKLYQLFCKSPEIQSLLRGKGSQPLKAISILRKLCNHPDLVDLSNDLVGSEKYFPEGYTPHDRRDVHTELSGKMMVLERFLTTMRQTSKDKVVLISNFTQTLDIFEKMCRLNRWGCFRLDGTMAIKKRQKFVDRFNDPEAPEFIFLLSSKAGGCGINLIGANRLVLFDPDWNPASDQQALARIWRDGQKKTCFVYRFIATGSIEEKILQRQSHKMSLSSCMLDAQEGVEIERHFSSEDLRALFKFNEHTHCDTHDTYKCKRCRNGKQTIKAHAMLYGDAATWNHYTKDELHNVHDDLLRAEKTQGDEVSFVFQYCSH
ncbi:putative RAD54-DNA-dependent ATPase of the Snf2p family [Ceraceosorus guamensis]|uniref:Putative RAD54-DNA-dependent ATPase of the Snf2p family n=1 Tax=Ceraceosorus guamensis TaxID=1522189 RepID=A0A316WEJ7_9BASI|nr:putative RAD54-DNA-dependent ATPase of the Snf2p family [Ceraceosorus guamensis]PWN45805.1 putative RAD54-DNA-dependent ATPase of the Snf2p family [Ceraceosorus guamensis]